MNQFIKAQKIFEEILDMEASHIDHHIKTNCGNDKELLKLVLDLVKTHRSIPDETKVNIETRIGHLLSTESNSEGATRQTIEFNSDRYKIIKKIGDGGMGSVYLCHRKHDNFMQKVAIKLLNNVKNSQEIIHRFNQEKQILAELEHNNIAQFIDTGHLSDDTPFVVMEYTPGLTIDSYCSEHQLSVKQKLDLFLQLCSAVQHAHQNLIIHRDIKPNNILVSENGTVKLIDFGIAKYMSGDDDLNTQTGQHVMTPAYASPEQLLRKNLNTSTDIYSLGLILYEILTGKRPYDHSKTSPAQYEKLILTEQIELPSHRSNSFIDPDLDAITLKALQANPEDRYASVTAFVTDINLHLNNLPITARKPNFIYKAKKFLLRNWLATSAAALFGLMLIIFIVEIINEKNKTERERVKAETFSDSFIMAFKHADPTQTLGDQVKAIHILDQVKNIIVNNHAEDSILLNELSVSMTEVYLNMGAFDKALQLIEEVGSESNIQNLSDSKQSDLMLLKTETLLSIEKFDAAITTLDSFQPANEQHEIQHKLLRARVLTSQGLTQESLSILEPLMKGVDKSNVLYQDICLANFSLQLVHDPIDKQIQYLNDCLITDTHNSIQQKLSKSEILKRLGFSFSDKEEFHASNKHYLDALAIDKEIFGDLHISQVRTYRYLGWNYMKLLDFEKSIENQNLALSISEKYFGKGHPNTSNAIYNLGHVYSNKKEFSTAINHYNKAIDIMLNNGLNQELKLGFYYKSLGHLQNDLGSYPEAQGNIEKSIQIFDLKQGGYVYRAAEMRVLLAHILFNQGQNDQATELLQTAMPLMYVMHKDGDYYQELGEDLSTKLNVTYTTQPNPGY